MSHGLQRVMAQRRGAAATPVVVGDPRSMLLVRVFADRLEVNEHLTQDRTLALFRTLRRLGVEGEIIFRTPCG